MGMLSVVDFVFSDMLFLFSGILVLSSLLLIFEIKSFNGQFIILIRLIHIIAIMILLTYIAALIVSLIVR